MIRNWKPRQLYGREERLPYPKTITVISEEHQVSSHWRLTDNPIVSGGSTSPSMCDRHLYPPGRSFRMRESSYTKMSERHNGTRRSSAGEAGRDHRLSASTKCLRSLGHHDTERSTNYLPLHASTCCLTNCDILRKFRELVHEKTPAHLATPAVIDLKHVKGGREESGIDNSTLRTPGTVSPHESSGERPEDYTSLAAIPVNIQDMETRPSIEDKGTIQRLDSSSIEEIEPLSKGSHPDKHVDQRGELRSLVGPPESQTSDSLTAIVATPLTHLHASVRKSPTYPTDATVGRTSLSWTRRPSVTSRGVVISGSKPVSTAMSVFEVHKSHEASPSLSLTPPSESEVTWEQQKWTPYSDSTPEDRLSKASTPSLQGYQSHHEHGQEVDRSISSSRESDGGNAYDPRDPLISINTWTFQANGSQAMHDPPGPSVDATRIKRHGKMASQALRSTPTAVVSFPPLQPRKSTIEWQSPLPDLSSPLSPSPPPARRNNYLHNIGIDASTPTDLASVSLEQSAVEALHRIDSNPTSSQVPGTTRRTSIVKQHPKATARIGATLAMGSSIGSSSRCRRKSSHELYVHNTDPSIKRVLTADSFSEYAPQKESVPKRVTTIESLPRPHREKPWVKIRQDSAFPKDIAEDNLKQPVQHHTSSSSAAKSTFFGRMGMKIGPESESSDEESSLRGEGTPMPSALQSAAIGRLSMIKGASPSASAQSKVSKSPDLLYQKMTGSIARKDSCIGPCKNACEGDEEPHGCVGCQDGISTPSVDWIG